LRTTALISWKTHHWRNFQKAIFLPWQNKQIESYEGLTSSQESPACLTNGSDRGCARI